VKESEYQCLHPARFQAGITGFLEDFLQDVPEIINAEIKKITAIFMLFI
jgi:hypothetical protein